jgi:flagellar hook-associated protein 1 FlgK
MVNFGAKILGNSVSAMTAQQALLANSSNNIANVNTPGYTRREIAIELRSDPATVDGILRIGSGVQLGEVRRITDAFLESSLRQANSGQSAASVKHEYLARVENVFSLNGDKLTVGSTLNDFFSSLNRLSIDPANLDLRFDVIQRGQDLVTAIRTTFQEIATAQTELDQRVAQDVYAVNGFTTEIAKLNGVIAQREALGKSAPDERDQRDVVLAKLAEKVSFRMIELPNGMVNCSLDNGFPLVSEATARSLSTTTEPSFASGNLPPSLDGRVLNYVVFNFGTTANPSHLDLTRVLKNGGGSIGGALQVRGYADPTNTSAYEADGSLVELATKMEALTRALLTGMNKEYRGPDEDSTTPAVAEPSAADLNGDPPDVFGLFDFDFSGVKDADGDGVATVADLQTTGIDSFSRLLRFAVSTPDRIAAARDVDSTEGATAFTLGDGRNAQAVVGLRTTALDFNLGNLSFNGTFDELYNSAVSTVGSLKGGAQIEFEVARNNYVSASTKRDEFSSVSLDEEFANVIKYQKAFQASARMIRTASELIDTIVGLI